MASHEKNKESRISLVDAVGALSAIAELDVDHEGMERLQEQLLDEEKSNQLRFLASYDGHLDMVAVRKIFQTIHRHLIDLYKGESSYVADEKKNERVKTIMILVGEAATKMDKLTEIFHDTQNKSIHELQEFQQLQEFYIERIARKIDEGMLGKWILGISYGEAAADVSLKSAAPVSIHKPANLHTNHVFIDLDGVKKDSEYELFFIKKEDGTRFFNPKLIRSIKLISDFGSYFKSEKTDDPFADIDLTVDKSLYAIAKGMVSSLKSAADRFYREAARHHENEMALELHKAFIALLLASNSKNLLKNNPIKTCSEYFTDFQGFLRSALQTKEYQRLIAYPEQKPNALNSCLSDTVEAVMYALYVSKPGLQDLMLFIENLIHEAVQEQSEEHAKAALESKTLWSKLASDYAAMNKLIKRHPNGHLKKILEMVSEGNYKYFDPLFQHNIPMELYHLYCDDLKMVNIRIPAPIYQEYIQKAVIHEEFKVFLRSLKKNSIPAKILLFNYQDRTSWREHARAKALEDLQKNPEFAGCLTVVTIPKETEFYNQDSPYDVDNSATDFIKHFKEHLSDDNAGFYFPTQLQKKDFEKFIDQAIKAIHHLFFHSKNVLTKDQRLDFIEIFYFFLELKVLDLVKPNYYSFCCKDAVDISSAANAKSFAFLTLLNQEKLSDNDRELLNLMLYQAPIMVRERLMLQDRFNRMLSSLKVFESVKGEFDPKIFSKIIKEAFVLLYDTPILDAKILPLR